MMIHGELMVVIKCHLNGESFEVVKSKKRRNEGNKIRKGKLSSLQEDDETDKK